MKRMPVGVGGGVLMSRGVGYLKHILHIIGGDGNPQDYFYLA